VPKIKIDKVEFYITNVCNLTCTYCNRFNNLNFKGWQDWNDYSEIYARWAELIEINQGATLLGGEPLLNPTVCDWALGLVKLWNKPIQILSNGTRINHVARLYDTIKNHKVWLGVTLHNIDQTESILADIEHFLHAPVTRNKGKQGNKFDAPIVLSDTNGVTIPVWVTSYFSQNAIIKQNNNWTLHNSDPEAAHSICSFAQHKCYHFIRGKLYKCGPVALLPELDQQIGLHIGDQDRALLNSYQPLTLENFDSYHKEFFDRLDDAIPQCKFCPSYIGGSKIWPLNKKSAQ
jgi:organic radical activating enzyme